MPDTDPELDFSTLALAHRLLTHDQLEQAQEIQKREARSGQPPRPIEEVLLEQGIMKREEVWAVYKAQERLMRDARNIGRRIGGYEILGKLGEGGLGVVYKARQLSMGRTVALKVLHEKWVGDDEFRKRFLVEARLVGRLSHQNLIQVFDVGRYKSTLYYSMEFVNGETVEVMLDRDGPLDIQGAIDIAFQIGRALHYLSTKKIVHRDVKPGNIMLTRSRIAKLGDFGFVKSSLDSVLSPDGEVLGTPDYISPEAALGDRNLDFRSDLYSLGATFYHMLTGKPPFGGTGSAVMEAHIRDNPPSMLASNPDLPPRACTIVERMMAKNPDDRFQSYEELFEDLEMLRLETKPETAEEEPAGGSGRARERLDTVLVREENLQKKFNLLCIAMGVQSVLLVALLLYVLLMHFLGPLSTAPEPAESETAVEGRSASSERGPGPFMEEEKDEPRP